MISVVRNLLVQNILKKGLRGDHLVQLRCISKSYQVNSSDYLKKNRSLDRSSVNKPNKTTRNLPTIVYSPGSVALPKDKYPEIMSYFPDFVRELKEKAEKYDSFGTGEHLDRVLQYNARSGKNFRAVTVLLVYKSLAPKSAMTEANIKLSVYLGWCIELSQTFMLMQDDIEDESLTRRGQPCWYKVEDIGMSCINDALMLESCIYQILKDHFSHLDCYVKLLELFHKATYFASLGQNSDLRTKYDDVLSFTMERHKSIMTYKTSFHTFYLPIALAMYLAGNTDQEGLRQAKSIFSEMGHLFGIQDDFLDCFGDPDVPNTIGSDIQNNSCTWLVVKCLERANEVQKIILKENYGKNDEESVRRVKKLYEELSLPEVFEKYEEEAYNNLRTKIQQNSLRLPVEIYLKMISKLHKREL